MHALITALVGSGGALLLGGIAWLISKYCGHLPSRWRVGHKGVTELIEGAAIVVMLLAGTEMAFGGAGAWIVSVLVWLRRLLGTDGGVIFTLITLGLLLAFLVHVLKRPEERALLVAFLLPLFMATFSFGVFHNLDAFVAPYAHQATAAVTNALGA